MNDIDQNPIADALNNGFVPQADKQITVPDSVMANTQSILQKAREAQQLYMDETEIGMMKKEQAQAEGKEYIDPSKKNLIIGDMVIPPLTPDQAPYMTTYEPIHGHDFKGAVVQRNGKNYKSVKTENPNYLGPEERADMIRFAEKKLEDDKKKAEVPSFSVQGIEDIAKMVDESYGEESTFEYGTMSLSQITADVEKKLQGYALLACEKQGKQLKITVEIP